MSTDPISNIVVSGLDQTLPVRQAEKEIYAKVDVIIQEAVEEGNPRKGFQAMEGLLSVGRVAGLALAKFIYIFKFQWSKFNSPHSFEQEAEEYLGLQAITIKRYYRVWKMLVEGEIPKEYLEKLKLLPMRSLIPISNLQEQGYEAEDKDWLRLSNAPDLASINKIIREIKGTEPRKGSIQGEWDAEQRQLTVWKDGKPHFVGFQYDERDEVVVAFLTRLFDGKVMEK